MAATPFCRNILYRILATPRQGRFRKSAKTSSRQPWRSSHKGAGAAEDRMGPWQHVGPGTAALRSCHTTEATLENSSG